MHTGVRSVYYSSVVYSFRKYSPLKFFFFQRGTSKHTKKECQHLKINRNILSELITFCNVPSYRSCKVLTTIRPRNRNLPWHVANTIRNRPKGVVGEGTLAAETFFCFVSIFRMSPFLIMRNVVYGFEIGGETVVQCHSFITMLV